MAFDEYRRRMAPHIDSRLSDLVAGQEFEELFTYAMAGGKRFRPALTLLVGEALSAPPTVAMDLACSVELTHCASLVLDDIIDGHGERRGMKSLHRDRGLRPALAAGFTLPSVALHLAAGYGARPAQLLTEAWVAMCTGVLREEDAHSLSLEDRYLAIVDAKTARLFATAAAFGVLALGGGAMAEPIEAYGFHVGRAFQMADDIVDGRTGEALPPTLEGRREEVLMFAARRLPKEIAAAEAAISQAPLLPGHRRILDEVPTAAADLKARGLP